MNKINIYDFDGTITSGVHPRKDSIILTGRCIDEKHEVFQYFLDNNLYIEDYIFYFNPIMLKDRGNHTEKARNISGNHKANIIRKLIENGVEIGLYFEDDPVQANIVLEQSGLPANKLVKIPETIEL